MTVVACHDPHHHLRPALAAPAASRRTLTFDVDLAAESEVRVRFCG